MHPTIAPAAADSHVSLLPSHPEASTSVSKVDDVIRVINEIKTLLPELRDATYARHDVRMNQLVDGVSQRLSHMRQEDLTPLEARDLKRILHEQHQLCAALARAPGRFTDVTLIQTDTQIWAGDTCEAMLELASSNLACIDVTHIATLAHAVTFLDRFGSEDRARFLMSQIEPMLNVAVNASSRRHIEMLDEQHCAERIEIGTKMEKVLLSGGGDPVLKVAVGVFKGLWTRVLLPELPEVVDDVKAKVAEFNGVLAKRHEVMALSEPAMAEIRRAKERNPEEDLMSQIFNAFFRDLVVGTSRPAAPARSWFGGRLFG